MTDDEMRVAIAEACGWKAEHHHDYVDWVCPDGCGWYPQPPDYPNDLNACAEFQRTMTKDEQPLYFRALCPDEWAWIDHNAWPVLCFATARQRCEAFLKVKGLWK